ncbi:MAG: hypothetical protein J4N32_02955 [Chloroflexi bacterium]|nr:hypothetical protein [Chloroflexota bacterium]
MFTFFAGSRMTFIGSPPSSTMRICSCSSRRYMISPLSDSPSVSRQRWETGPCDIHAMLSWPALWSSSDQEGRPRSSVPGSGTM